MRLCRFVTNTGSGDPESVTRSGSASSGTRAVELMLAQPSQPTGCTDAVSDTVSVHAATTASGAPECAGDLRSRSVESRPIPRLRLPKSAVSQHAKARDPASHVY